MTITTSTTIACLGLSFRTAAIDLRERLSFDDATARAALERFRRWRDTRLAPGAELVILSTCNRLELYLALNDDPTGDSLADPPAGCRDRPQSVPTTCGRVPMLSSFIAELSGLDTTYIEPYLYRFEQVDAVQHLCRVAAGLDSMVLGESQILGQVNQAFDTALQEDSAGPALSAAFRTAIRAGKRVHAETTIGRNAVSVGSAAVRVAEQVMGQAALLNAQVLVVGAGMTAELVIKALRARGVTRLAVANRTRAHAAVLAQRWGGLAFDLEHLDALVDQADVIITSTGAPHPVIRFEHIQSARRSRPSQPIVLIDIAVPRDVEPAVGDIPGVHLLNLDDLQTHVDASMAERQSQVPFAEAIVAQEVQVFEQWQRTADIHPLITDLRKQAEAIRQSELERAMRHLPNLDPQTREYIQGLTHALVNKLLHEPTTRLRAIANDEHASEYAQSARFLFGLNAQRSSLEGQRSSLEGQRPSLDGEEPRQAANQDQA